MIYCSIVEVSANKWHQENIKWGQAGTILDKECEKELDTANKKITKV
ncbi:MAG: hypothetical protein ABRQ27_09175 [Clostridiaceae bacterium]